MNLKERLPSSKECIAYVESLGYKFNCRSIGGVYHFDIVDKTKRPKHNWHMDWSLRDMRDAVLYGC